MSLWVSEYGTISRGNANLSTMDGNLQLCATDFEALISLTELKGDSEDDLDQILSFHRRGGQDQLKVKNYVGVIRVPSGTQIEILPKLAKKLEIRQSRQQLIKMLTCLKESPFRHGTAASLDAHRMPLFELFLKQYLDHVVDIVKYGIARNYVAEQGNLRFLRGKLVMSEQIKRNTVNRAEFYCEFDEYEVNRPINRLIRGALDIVARCSSDSKNVRLCNELRFVFDRVPPTQNAKLDFARLQRDRSIQHYESALPLCELILNGLNPLTNKGANSVFSLLFPMERVFENYVFVKLKNQFSNMNVSAQIRSRHLVEDVALTNRFTGEKTTKKLFLLKPDLELKGKNNNLHVIADTKWKLLNQQDSADKYGIKQSDMYQLFAYGEKYLGNSDNDALVLIYPRSIQFTEPLPIFWFDVAHQNGLHILPYDLNSDELILNDHLVQRATNSNFHEIQQGNS